MSETARRTPAEIEAAIAERRRELAATLDEIAIRVHPSTIAGDVKARAVEAVDRTAGRALSVVGRGVSGVRGQFVSEDGKPRMSRLVPAAAVVVAVAGLVVVTSRRRR